MGGKVAIAQFDYYVLWPVCIACGLLAVAWVVNVFRRWHLLLTGASIVALLCLLPFLLFYTGGI